MRAILFDLDGTLLDIDLGAFLRRYFAALNIAAASLPLSREIAVMDAIMLSTQAMMEAHPGRTNREVFYADFLQRSGVDLHDSWDVFERFYAEEFPALGDGLSARPGAREAVVTALDLGLRVAVATNPIFPRAAIEHRLSWAGLADLPFDVITTYETMHACKPAPSYFIETAAMLGVEARACMMVGDDDTLDLPAANAGMSTFYVGDHEGAVCDYRGTLSDLSALLPRLAG